MFLSGGYGKPAVLPRRARLPVCHGVKSGGLEVEGLKTGEEVGDAGHRRLVGELEAVADGFAALVHVDDRVGEVFHVTVGVGTAGDGHAVQLQLGHDFFAGDGVLVFKGQSAEPHAAHGAFPVDFDGEHVRGEVLLGNVGEEASGVDEDGVAAHGTDNRHAALDEHVAEHADLAQAVGHVFFIHHFAQAHGQSVGVASGKAAVGDEAFEEHHAGQQVHVVLFGAEHHQTADVDHGVLLAGNGGAVGGIHHGLQNGGHAHVRAFRFAFLDEEGVFGHAGGVEEQLFAVLSGHGAHVAQVLQAHGLAAAGVVGDGDHDEGNLVAVRLEGVFQLGEVDVALEGLFEFGLEGGVNHAVDGRGLRVEHVRAGGVEGHVDGNEVAGLHQRADENVFRRAALMGGNDVVEAQHFLHGVLEAEEAVGAGVGFVAQHEGGPLFLAQRAGAGVGKQVDVHVLGLEREHIVMRFPERLLALFLTGQMDAFDGFEAERFGQCTLHKKNLVVMGKGRAWPAGLS